MFIAALFTIAKTWRQPICGLGGEWVKCDKLKQWNIIQN